jgi:hypothetical protein
MAIADYLQKIGHGLEEGVETAGRVAGAVAEPLGKSVAETLSGEAPQIHAEKRQHAQQLSDEQRQNEINDLEKQLDEGRKYGTLTTEQQKQYTDAIARHYSDPSQMGTLIQKLHKATHPGGATYQPYAPQLADPTPTGGEARADETEKLKYQADEAKQQQEQNQENTKASWDFFSKFIPDEDKPKAQSEWAMKNLGVAQTLKNIPGAAGQPVKGADGRYYLPKEQADGTIVQDPMPPNWSPAPKPAQPKPGVSKSDGGNTYAVETPEGWKSTITGKILTDFRPMPNYAQVAPTIPAIRAQYEVNPVTDDQGTDVLQTRASIVNAARGGRPMTAGVVGAPSGLDKKNQMLAASALQQVDRMERILKEDPNLTGSGQLTQLQTWLGIQDPDAQQFILSGLLGSEHGVAVFGGRNIHTINDLNNVLSNMKTNPEALRGALQVIRETMTPWMTARGRLPTGAQRIGGILPKTGAKPSRATMKVPGSDGKMHWSDGKVDLGVVQ